MTLISRWVWNLPLQSEWKIPGSNHGEPIEHLNLFPLCFLCLSFSCPPQLLLWGGLLPVHSLSPQGADTCSLKYCNSMRHNCWICVHRRSNTSKVNFKIKSSRKTKLLTINGKTTKKNFAQFLGKTFLKQQSVSRILMKNGEPGSHTRTLLKTDRAWDPPSSTPWLSEGHRSHLPCWVLP